MNRPNRSTDPNYSTVSPSVTTTHAALIPEGDLLELITALRSRATAARELRDGIHTRVQLAGGSTPFLEQDLVRWTAQENSYLHAADMVQDVLTRARPRSSP